MLRLWNWQMSTLRSTELRRILQPCRSQEAKALLDSFLIRDKCLVSTQFALVRAPIDDPTSGVLLGSVSENGRDVSDVGGIPIYSTASTVSDLDPTSTNTNSRTDGLSLVVRRAGTAASGSTFDTDGPFASNLGAAYFPYSEGWLAGTVSASADNGPLDTFVGSPGLSLGTNFIVDGVGTNKHRVLLPGVTDSRRQGLLFVNHAKNEGNYALTEPDDQGNGFVVVTHDNATDGPTTTVDPLSFVFIPLGTSNVTMGRIHPSSGATLQPAAMLKSGDFTIVREGDVSPGATFDVGIGGKYRLSIPGQSPSTGVLLVSPSTVGRDASGGNTDNIVTYQADGNDWIILCQDLPDITGVGAWSRERNSYFNFAFIPLNAPPTAPAAIPAPHVTKSRIWGFNSQLIRQAAGQESGGAYGVVTQHTADVNVQWLSENYGDFGFAADGDFLTIEDGIPFSTVNEGLRNNSATGGLFEYGISSVGRFVPEWTVFTDAASPLQGEHEVNVAVTFFGANSGFQMAAQANVPTAAPNNGKLSVTLSGVGDTRTSGVLIAQPSTNGDNYALASPKSDGSGWDVEVHDDSTGFEGANGAVNYIYLPYTAQNLIAGRVDEDGTLLSSTDPSGFTLAKTGTGTYSLSIPGKSPLTGMLLLTGSGATGSVDNVLVYEADGEQF